MAQNCNVYVHYTFACGAILIVVAFKMCNIYGSGVRYIRTPFLFTTFGDLYRCNTGHKSICLQTSLMEVNPKLGIVLEERGQ